MAWALVSVFVCLFNSVLLALSLSRDVWPAWAELDDFFLVGLFFHSEEWNERHMIHDLRPVGGTDRRRMPHMGSRRARKRQIAVISHIFLFDTRGFSHFGLPFYLCSRGSRGATRLGSFSPIFFWFSSGLHCRMSLPHGRPAHDQGPFLFPPLFSLFFCGRGCAASRGESRWCRASSSAWKRGKREGEGDWGRHSPVHRSHPRTVRLLTARRGLGVPCPVFPPGARAGLLLCVFPSRCVLCPSPVAPGGPACCSCPIRSSVAWCYPTQPNPTQPTRRRFLNFLFFSRRVCHGVWSATQLIFSF